MSFKNGQHLKSPQSKKKSLWINFLHPKTANMHKSVRNLNLGRHTQPPYSDRVRWEVHEVPGPPPSVALCSAECRYAVENGSRLAVSLLSDAKAVSWNFIFNLRSSLRSASCSCASSGKFFFRTFKCTRTPRITDPVKLCKRLWWEIIVKSPLENV